jgi:hypothetical protein
MYRGLNAEDISEDENEELLINELEVELRELDEGLHLINYTIDFKPC